MTRRAARFTEAELRTFQQIATECGVFITVEPKDDEPFTIMPEVAKLSLGRDDPKAGCAYFIVCGPYVKIGYSAYDGTERLRAMRTGNPFLLHLSLTLKGNMDLERMLQRQFWHHRHQYEWFHLSEEIKAFILEKGGTLP